jgi:hypothetical protein
MMRLLKGGSCKIKANRRRFDGNNWLGSKDYEILDWREAAFG